MIKRISALALCAAVLGSTTLAQHSESSMELALNDGQGEDIVIRIDSKEQGFDLHKMQLGESHALNTVDGRPVLITRVADGLTFDVDGRQISMPMMEHEAMDHDGASSHKEVRIMQHAAVSAGTPPDGVTIISPTPLDDATRASITATLAAAGMADVRFIDIAEMGPGPHSMHVPAPGAVDDVRVIRKEVYVTN